MRIARMFLLTGIFAAIGAGCTTTGKTTGDVIDDTAVASRVKTQLLREDFGEGFEANVEVYKGIVQLGGFIDEAADGRRMVEVARGVDGVVEVDNVLQERGPERSAGQAVDDGITTSRIKARIASEDFGDALALNVSTYNGNVLITGFVTSAKAKASIEDIAERDDNTRNVINGLRVVDPDMR